MAKKCSINPQILSNNKEVDSLAFSQLWERAKSIYSDPVEARDKAKAEYYDMFQPAFKSLNGDWDLLYRYNNNLMTDQDRLLFTNKYNEDLELLKNSIRVPLDINGEPVVTEEMHSGPLVELDRWVNTNSDFIPDSHQIFFNRVASHIILNKFETLSNLRNTDIFKDESIRLAVIKELEDTYSLNKNENVNRLIQDIKEYDSFTWDTFVGYFKNKFNYKITDDSLFEDDATSEERAEIPKNWDDQAQLKMDHLKTVAVEIKEKLAKSVALNTKLVTEGIDGKFSGNMEEFDMNIPLDIDDIWHKIQSINYQSTSKEDVIRRLQYESTVAQNGALDGFIEELQQEDGQLYNLFHRTCLLAITDNFSLVVDRDVDSNNSANYSYRENNRKSKATNIADNFLRNSYETSLKNSADKIQFKNDLIGATTLINNATKSTTRQSDRLEVAVNAIQTLSEKLGTKMSRQSIMFYINHKTNSNYGYTDITGTLKTLSEDPVKFQQTYALLSELNSKFGVIARSIAYSGNKVGKKANVEVTSSNKFILNKASKGALHDISFIVAMDYAHLSSMSYYSSDGEKEQSPQNNSYITDFFRDINVNAVEGRDDSEIFNTIKDKFNDYFKDVRLDNDNFLWSQLDSNGNYISKGLFFFKVDSTGRKIATNIDIDTFKNFNLIAGDGNVNTNSNSGIKYRDLKGDAWNLTYVIDLLSGKFNIPISDSGRDYKITKSFEQFNEGLPKEVFDDNGMIDLEYLKDNIVAFETSRIYRYAWNNLMQDVTDVSTTFEKMFNLESYKEGKLELNDEFKNNKTALIEGIEIDSKTDEDGFTTHEAIRNGKPTGSAFKLSLLEYVKDGRKVNFGTFLESKGYNALQFIVLDSSIEGHNTLMNNLFREFMYDWLIQNQKDTAETFKYIKEDILNATSKVNTTDDLTETWIDTEDKEAKVKKDNHLIKRTENYNADRTYGITALNLFLNNHFNSVSFGNLLYGSPNEYKQMIDFNKRVNQTTRNGASTTSNRQYNQMIIEDLQVKDHMLDFIDNPANGTVQQRNLIKERFSGLINTADAFNVITDQEFIARLKDFGVYDRYAKMIDDINNESIPFNPNEYEYLIEQLKYFSYERMFDRGRMLSVQNKNSTIVLFKRFTNGTEMGQVYDMMIANDIQDINTKSAHKKGGVVPFRLHDPITGKLDSKQLTIPKAKMFNSVISLNVANLRIQQDTVPHILNTKNTIPTQVSKKIFDGLINDGDYTSGSLSVKGRTGNYEDGKRGIFEENQHAMSYNAKESMLQLLNTFGAMKDGKVMFDPLTNTISVNIPKIIKTLEDYFLEQTTDMNLIKAVRLNANNESNVPLHYPTILRLIESVLEAKITNNITRQKLAGIHAPIMPGMFISPSIDKTTDDTYTTYTKEFKDQISKEGGVRLRSEYRSADGVYHPAQIVINPWDKRFYKKEYLMDDGSGRIDIDKIKTADPKILLMYGTRIPHEGKQSSYVAEVVGFLQTGSSQVITPDHLVMRTGWDFDIDTVYQYTYEANDKLKTYDTYADDQVSKNRRLDRWAKLYYPEAYREQVTKSIDKIRTLQREMDAINTKYNPIIDELIDTALDNKIEDAKDIIQKFNDEIASNPNISDDRLSYLKDGILKQTSTVAKLELLKYNEADIDPKKLKDKADKRKEETSKLNKEVHDAIRTRRTELQLRQEIIDKYKANVNYFTKFKESKLDEFNQLDKIQQATREERSNTIVDSLIGMLSAKTAIGDTEKPNEVDHVFAASNYINNILGINNSLASMTSISDQLRFRNLNMNIATLKEIAVAHANTVSIMGTLRGKVEYNKVPVVMEYKEFQGYDGKHFGSIESGIKEIFGAGNYSYDNKTQRVTIKNIGFVGNNASTDTTTRNDLDIQGQPISEQYSEIVANILDAVSKPMISLTPETFPIFAFIASTPLSHFTNITGKQDTNRFIYPSLLVSQPAIQELSQNIVMNNRFGDISNSAYSQSIVEDQYLKNIINPNLDDLISYATTKSKNVTFSDLPFEFVQAYNEMNKADMNMDDINKDAARKLEALKEAFGKLSENLIKYRSKGILGKVNMSILDHFITRQLHKSTILGDPNTITELANNIKQVKTLDESKYNTAIRNVEDYDDKLDYLLEHDLNEDALNKEYKEAREYIKYYEENIIDHSVSQLNVLAYYNKVEMASNDVKSTMGIFNTDKLGAGPTSSVSNNLFNNIVRFDTNLGKFESYLKNRGEDDMVDTMKTGLNGRVSLKEKLDYIHQIMDSYGYDAFKAPMTNNKGISLTSAVYGEVFNNNVDPNVLNSDFPYLQAQLMYSNIFSTQVYANVILSEKPEVKQLLNNIASKLKGVKDDEQRYKTLTYVINQKVNEIPFFQNVDHSKIISAVKVGWTETETEKGTVHDFVITEQENVDINNLNARAESDRLDYFKSLTLVNQIRLLKQVGTYNQFLERVNILSDEKLIKELGYIKLSMYDSDAQINEIRVMFKNMYTSNNPYDRVVANNLIRYTFLQNGLQFGSNIAKFMPIEIIFNSEETHPDDRHLGLSELAEVIRNPSLPIDETDEFIEHLHQANADNVAMNPIMEPTYTFNKKTNSKEINYSRPTFRNYMNDTEGVTFENESIAEHIIVEKADLINSSKYVDREYLQKVVKILDSKYSILYRRAEQSRDGYIMYYPIVKTLAFEYGSTDIEMNKMLPNLDNNNQIYTKDEYEAEIQGTRLEVDREFPAEVNEGVDSYTSNVRTAVSKSDVILYIGDANSFRARVAKTEANNSNKAFNSVTVEQFTGFNVNSINFNRMRNNPAKSILLMGDLNVDLSKEQDSKVRANINKLVKANNIETINIVGTKGFESIVAKTNLKAKLNIEGKEMFAGALEDINTVYSENTGIESYSVLINKIKALEETILATAARFKTSLKDVKVANRSDLERVTNQSRKLIQGLDPLETSYEALLDVVEANKSIFKFVKDRLDDLADDILVVQPGEYAGDTDANYKRILEINDQLKSLYDHIFVARHSVSLPLIGNDVILALDDADAIDMFTSYNTEVEDLRYHIPMLERLMSQTTEKMKKMQGLMNLRISKNSSLVNSVFSQVRSKLMKEGIATDVTITPAMITDAVERMMNRNEDISWFQANLDSRRDMYVTLPDVTMKFYSEVHFRTYAKAARDARTLSTIASKVFKDTNKEYSKDRAATFLSKFVSSTGEWIEEHDMEALSAKSNEINNQIATKVDLRRDAYLRGDMTEVKRIGEEMQTLRDQRDSLTTLTPLDSTSAKYSYYENAYNTISERQRKNFEQSNHIKFITDARLSLTGISERIPNDEFVNKQYASLTTDEKEFIENMKDLTTKLINDVFETKVVGRNFIPFKTNTTLATELKHFTGWASIVPESNDIDLNNERIYVKQSQMLKKSESPNKIIIGTKYQGEKDNTYQKRILNEINKDRTTPFATVQDVRDYNTNLDKKFAEEHKSDRNFDIVNLMSNFIDDMAQVEVSKKFENTYRLALLTMGSPDFKASVKTLGGKNVSDKLMAWITGKREVVSKSGKETEIYKAFASIDKALKGTSRVQSKYDQAASLLLRTTSMSTMAFNFKGGISNVLFDYANRVGDALSGEYFDKTDLAYGTGKFIASRMSVFADFGKTETNNFYVGLIKAFHALYEDKTEAHAGTEIGAFGKGISIWDKLSYGPMNSGEILTQFSTLLSMLHSNRLITAGNASQYMSLSQFIGDRRLETIKEHLTTAQYNEISAKLIKARNNTTNNTGYWDIFNNWMIRNAKDFSSDQMTAMKNSIKEVESNAKVEFEKYERLESQFELHDGIIRIKEGSFMTEKIASDFMNTVRAVNHSLSGIYNTIDRNAIQDQMVGEIVMQFSKWIRPTFNRYFGAKYGKTQFSEATGTYRAGAYTDLWDFMTTPFKSQNPFNSDESNSTIEAGKNIFNGYIQFLGNVSFYYHMLPSHKKANVIRAIVNMSSILGISLAMYAVSKMAGADDKDKKQGQFALLSMYELSRLQSDLTQTLPYFGWFSFYKQRKTNIVPAERTITDLARLTYYMTIYPFQDQDQREYQRGMYNGETKLSVVAQRLAPGIRQIQSHEHLGSSVSYYQMYNPVANFMSDFSTPSGH